MCIYNGLPVNKKADVSNLDFIPRSVKEEEKLMFDIEMIIAEHLPEEG